MEERDRTNDQQRPNTDIQHLPAPIRNERDGEDDRLPGHAWSDGVNVEPQAPEINPAHLQREGIVPAGDELLRRIEKATSPRDLDGREQSPDPFGR